VPLSPEARAHSAVHLLKGAAEKVLGATLTTAVYVSGGHGRLAVRLDRRPTELELATVEEAANSKVAEGAEFIEFEMERSEAEGHFGHQIYDAFPVPPEVKILQIVRIPDWNINCCAHDHVGTASEVGKIKLGRSRFRPARGELEMEFDLSAEPTGNIPPPAAHDSGP
jgi:alanyl-tRNA synthetase